MQNSNNLETDVIADVDEELEDETLAIESPFSPEKIRIRTKPALVEQIIRRIEHGEIDLAPPFQRQAGIWKLPQKARLIESLLLRIPLPVFYVAADPQDAWAVVDGLQRITTIKEYVGNVFALSGLSYLTQFTNYRYENLPRSMQRRIDETELVVHIIEPGTPEEVMFNIFSRINTGGAPLNGQEIRHALHKGPAREYLRQLAETEDFLNATDHAIRRDRMADRECILRFLAFRLVRWEEYRGELDGFLSAAMKQINHLSQQQWEELAKDFHRAMRAAHTIFNNNAFRKARQDDWRNPINKALFETWSVTLAGCDDGEIDRLIAVKDEIMSAFRNLSSDSSFVTSITVSTGNVKRVHKRFSSIESLVRQCLKAEQ